MNNYYNINNINDTYFNNANNNINFTENSTNMISRTYGINQLSGVFFSNFNIELLQDEIRKYIYFNSENNTIIGKQSVDELKIIMKSIYLSNRNKLSEYREIDDQVKFLNNLVILECGRIIKTNLSQHLHYIKNIDYKPTFQELPKNVSNKGIKNLEMYK